MKEEAYGQKIDTEENKITNHSPSKKNNNNTERRIWRRKIEKKTVKIKEI